MELRFLALVFCLQFLPEPGTACDLPAEHTKLFLSLNKKLLRSLEDDSRVPNPSIYLGLRLSGTHNLQMEKRYLQRLQQELEPSLGRDKSTLESKPTTGLLSLYLLSLRASCLDMNTAEANGLITQLKHKLHHEKEHIVQHKRPQSNYYQYSLGILALCVNGKEVEHHVVRKLIHAESHEGFLHGDALSIDTEAMAGLALRCLELSESRYNEELKSKIKVAIQSVRQKILQSQDKEGLFGNVFSTPVAVQALVAMEMTENRDQCSKALGALVDAVRNGIFHNPMAMSTLNPVFHQKTYLDIRTMDCIAEEDGLTLGPKRPGGDVATKTIRVELMVEDSVNTSGSYTQQVVVPRGSSLLHVLKEAQKQKPGEFSFETAETLWGPFLTSVRSMKAQPTERTYWQLLKDNTVLDEGIGDHKPVDGEHIILRLTKW
ncbi:transcobalamin-2 [Latimeria chalumnae]|uniref:Transcobalamin-2 n=1 Tax=Latimeria chalumnae TaxID=7897 RepID=H3A0H1_LATCH|nr:PREDICTED: transcobalamin-2 [Latimeria chalumnae]|eukprot:XP_005993347.1 PREDICTED: transcobalamin-2 [Latimeria chalumnae]